MAHVRLQTVKCQNYPPPSLGYPLEAHGVRQRQGEEFVVPFEQMAHGPWGNRHTAPEQMLMDFRQTAMLRVSQGTDPRHDIQAKLVLGQGKPSLFFWAIGAAELWTGAVEAAPDLQGQMH